MTQDIIGCHPNSVFRNTIDGLRYRPRELKLHRGPRQELILDSIRIGLQQKHRWDSNVATSTIVVHNRFRVYALFIGLTDISGKTTEALIVGHQKSCDVLFLGVSNFFNKGAPSTIYQ